MVAQPSLGPAWVRASEALPSQRAQAPARPADWLDPDVLRLAAQDGSLELLYQPEVDVSTGEIVAMEALLRWRYEGQRVIQPYRFLPLAHRHGVMEAIDTWVLDAGAAQAAAWCRLPGPVRTLWLNVSSAQLVDDRLLTRVLRAVNAHDLLPGALGLEISQQALVALGDRARPLLTRLRSFGVLLGADDVTSYYSGVDALAALPLDALKLSHRFVRDASDCHHDNRARTVLAQAHERGMHVVAEGVETMDEHARLVALGCDRAHGFLYSPPLPADQAQWLLEARLHWQGHSAGQRP